MKKRSAGFIIGTVLGIAIPRIDQALEVDLKSSLRKFGGAVKYSFNEAVIRQTVLRLNVDLDTQEYYLSVLAVNNQTGEFVELPSEFVDHEKLPDGVFFKDIQTPHNPDKTTVGQEFIVAYPTGYVEPGVVHIASRDGRVFTLQVKPLTGKVIILDGDVDFANLAPLSVQSNGTTSTNAFAAGNGTGWGKGNGKKSTSSGSGSGTSQ
jgi:hypothetical protein